MKTLFIESRKKFDNSSIDFSVLNKIPGKKISLASTVQYLDLIPEVKKYLESIGRKVLIKRGAYYDGHVLGCNSSAFDSTSDSILLITDGKFHAMNNAIQLQKEIYVFNGKTLDKIEQREIEEYNKILVGKKKIFLSVDSVGLIVSTKYGQNMKSIEKIKEKIEKLDKKVYIFEANNINANEFENFPQIKIWINTACFGLSRDDKRIINLSDILEFLG